MKDRQQKYKEKNENNRKIYNTDVKEDLEYL